MDYSDDRFGKMQEEAIRRVREMQQRSRSAVGQEDSPPPPPPPPPKKTDKPSSSSAGDLLSGILGDIKIDEEKALIALLIFILYKQGADIKLLLGLAYLLI